MSSRTSTCQPWRCAAVFVSSESLREHARIFAEENAWDANTILGVNFPGLGSVALLALLMGTARGAPLPAIVAVTRLSDAQDCPDAATLEADVSRILGAPIAEAAVRVPVRADVEFARGASGYRATLHFRGAKEGERTLTDTDPTCTALGHAVGITMSLLLDAPGSSSSLTQPSLIAPAAVVAPAPPSAGAPRATAAFVSLTGGPALGAVGPASMAGGAELDLAAGRRVRLLVGAGYVAPRMTAFEDGSVDVSLVVGHVGACGVLNDPMAAVKLSLCALMSAGQLRGRGNGFQTSNAGTLAWLAYGGGLRAQTIVRNRWLLGVAAGIEAPTSKYTFSVEKVGPAFTSHTVMGSLQFAVGVKIW